MVSYVEMEFSNLINKAYPATNPAHNCEIRALKLSYKNLVVCENIALEFKIILPECRCPRHQKQEQYLNYFHYKIL